MKKSKEYMIGYNEGRLYQSKLMRDDIKKYIEINERLKLELEQLQKFCSESENISE